MIPIVHVGLSPAIYHPAWANTDIPALIRIISVLQPTQQALVFLNAMVFGGVFERHPTLTVLFAEHGIDWIIQATARMDQLAAPGVSPLLLDDHKLPLSPGEYVSRNVRVTPLPVGHESPIPALEALPTVPVMSSDYPHFEGFGDPMGHYAKELAPCSDERPGVVPGREPRRLLRPHGRPDRCPKAPAVGQSWRTVSRTTASDSASSEWRSGGIGMTSPASSCHCRPSPRSSTLPWWTESSAAGGLACSASSAPAHSAMVVARKPLS